MATFADADDLQATLGTFLVLLMDDAAVSAAFGSTNALVKVTFHEPDANVWFDCREDPPAVTIDHDGEPDIELVMRADDGHRFWLGRLSFPVAVTSRKIRVNGPTSKLMKLLPVLKPIHRRYEAFLEDQGRHDLVAI